LVLISCKEKGKSFPCALPEHHAMKVYWGSGSIALLILDSTRRRWVVSFMPWLLYPPGEEPLYPLDRSLGGPHSQSGHSGEEKNPQSCCDLNSDHPAHRSLLYHWAIPPLNFL
jgi:hypothetical protein